MVSGMRVVADRDVCVGAGNCVLAAAGIFDQDDEGLVVVLDPAPPADREGAIEQAVRMCPSGAITAHPRPADR
jgi:ferredoxin